MVFFRALLILIAFLLLAPACRQYSADSHLQLTGATMGTTWSVVLKPGDADTRAIKQGLEKHLERINGLMSTYDSSSEISRFNQQSGSEWFPVSEDTVRVIALALEISSLTDGAFDISVGPLVDLWGFGAVQPESLPPAAAQIAAVLAGVGYENLQLRREPPAIRKKIPQLRIDLAAIAKGYAVDVLAHYLDQQQIEHYLVEIGGELKMKGVRSDGTAWRVAIEKPLDNRREVATVFPLTDIALASSGNYRNYYEKNGQRFVHTIDPASGKPIQHKLASATVLDPVAARADALATALMVMGEERGRGFCEEHQIAAYFIIHNKTQTSSYTSPAFQALLEKAQP
jgi:thiamine biosynthesis lipoprotein